MVRGYLEAERDLGRVTAGADLGTLAPMLASAVHLLFTDTDGPPPGETAVTRTVAAALAAATAALNPRHPRPGHPAGAASQDGATDHAATRSRRRRSAPGSRAQAGRKRSADQVSSMAT